MTTAQIRSWWSFGSVILASSAIVLGIWSYTRTSDMLLLAERSRLDAVAELKAREIELWVDERIGDAETLSSRRSIQAFLLGAEGSGTRTVSETTLSEHLDSVRVAYKYASVELYDQSGHRQAGVGHPVHESLDGIDPRVVDEARRHPALIDFHRSPGQAPEIQLSFLSAVRKSKERDAPVIGWTLLTVDPNHLIYPLIQSWPGHSLSAESLLVRRDGDGVVFLNRLRHSAMAPLAFHAPLTRATLPAAKAVLGQIGTVEGIDYRGIQVVASVRAIDGTPWFIVAKIDHDEIYKNLRLLTAIAVLLGAVMVSLFALLAWLALRQRNLALRLSAAEKGAAFQTVVDQSPDAILINKDDQHIYANTQASALFGYDNDELMSMRLGELTADEDKDAMWRFIVTLHGQGAAQGEIRMRRKDGHSIPVDVRAVTLPDGSLYGVFRDLSRQKEAEEKLRPWIELFAHAGFGLTVSNAETNVLLAVNEAYAEQHGYTHDELVGKSIFTVFPPGLAEPFMQRMAELDIVGHDAMETNHRRKDGRIFPVMLDLTIIKSAEGKPLKRVTCCIDMTEKKQAEFDRREQQNKYENLFLHMINGYAYCRMLYENDKSVDFVYEAVNPAFETLTGLKGVEGRRVTEVIPGIRESNPEILEAYGRVARTRAPERFEAYLAPLATWFNVSVFSPQLGYFAAVFENITERKLAETALLGQRQRMELLLDSMAEGMYGVDTEGNCTFINSAALAMLGFDEQEILGKHVHELIHHHRPDGQDYPAAECRAYRAYVQGQGIHVDDEVFWRRDGSSFSVEYWSYPMRVLGEVVGSVVTFLDITERLRAREQLSQVNQKLQTIIDTVPQYVFWKDHLSRYLGCNQAFAQMAGLDDPLEIVGKDDNDFGWRTYASIYQQDDAEVMRAEVGKRNIIEPMDVGGGEIAWLETSKEPLRDGRGKVIGVLGVFQDVTERMKAEAKLRQAAKVYESTMEGVLITDSAQRIIAVNQAFQELTGYSEAEALGKTPRLLHSGRQDGAFYRVLWSTIKQMGYWRGEIWNRRKSGEVYPEWLTINTVRDAIGQVTNYVAVFTDISQVKQAEDQLKHLAYHDPLTGLANRRLFNDRLDHAIQRAKREGSRLAVLYLDLDHFKTVNDSLGHPAGDQLLCSVAETLVHSVREQDSVGRLGGDEFVILLEDLPDESSSWQVAEKIKEALAMPLTLENHELVVTGSIGISTYPSNGQDAMTLLRNADTAMYRAKDEGRNTFRCYSADLTQHARERLTMESELRRAIEQEELVVYYQPQYDVNNGTLIGAEALVRWQHPQSGLISPARFIPIAESTGLIKALGEWVLNTACQQYRDWSDEGLPPFTLAVNLSPRQFVQQDLVQQVSAVLEGTGMPPGMLELEITEGAIMGPGTNAREVLVALRSLGIKLAIDDFGTGYSSLSYLRKFPINLLKIDQSFMRDIPHDKSAEQIAATIIAMARSLDLKVLAEGVETEEQFAFLKRHGCHYSQGYLHDRPLSAMDFRALLSRTSGKHH